MSFYSESPRPRKPSPNPASERERSGMDLRVLMRLVPAFIVGGLVVAFWVQNRDEVSFNFLWLDFEARLWVVIATSFVLGALFAVVISWWRGGRYKKELERDKKDS